MFFKAITDIGKIVLGLTVLITAASCSQNQPAAHAAHKHPGMTMDSAGIAMGHPGMVADTFYTCSMHPQIRQDQPVQARLEFVSPSFEPGRQATTVRAKIANPRRQFQPGMQATMLLSKGKTSTLTLPVDAVLRDGRGATVWVKTGPGAYESRLVNTGLENADQIEILRGLQPGDEVVISGAYLLQNEQLLKKGADPMAGHNMEK